MRKFEGYDCDDQYSLGLGVPQANLASYKIDSLSKCQHKCLNTDGCRNLIFWPEPARLVIIVGLVKRKGLVR